MKTIHGKVEMTLTDDGHCGRGKCLHFASPDHYVEVCELGGAVLNPGDEPREKYPRTSECREAERALTGEHSHLCGGVGPCICGAGDE
jgi:hypothetical protein